VHFLLPHIIIYYSHHETDQSEDIATGLEIRAHKTGTTRYPVTSIA